MEEDLFLRQLIYDKFFIKYIYYYIFSEAEIMFHLNDQKVSLKIQIVFKEKEKWMHENLWYKF